MLRHKRIINLSFYHYKKSLKSCDVRSFHVTYSSFLRKVASSRKRYLEISSANEEVAVAGNFVAQPLKSSFNNFYGIESDEGVIHVSEKLTTSKSSHDSFINAFSSKKLPEKFKKTSFGKVRLDTENKLIRHGQYEESTSVSDLDGMSRNSQLRNFAIEDSDANSSPLVEETQGPSNESRNHDSSHFDGIKNQTEIHAKTSKIDVGKMQNHEGANDISFIDELYFPDKFHQNQEDDNVIFENSTINAKDTSYIDECFFNNESTTKNPDNALKFTNDNGNFELGIKTYDNSSMQENLALSEEKLSYFDESFFDSKLNNMNTEGNIKLISEIDLNPEFKEINTQAKKLSSDNKEENMNFIDECFFRDDLESKVIGKNTKHSTENVSLPEISISHDNVKESKIHQIINEKQPISMSNSGLNVKNMEWNEDNILNYSRNTKTLDTMEHETLHYNPSELYQHDNDSSTRVVSSVRNNNFTYKEAMDESLNSIINPRIISDASLTNNYPNSKKSNESTLKHDNTSERFDAFNRKEIIKDDQPGTAFDFVKKFRGDQKVTYHESISGFSSVPKEKLDSKGFRILKYQVPKLKYYTRDEMLEVLVKNVLYSDDDVVVLNKPYSLVMHDSKTTKDACLSKYLDDFAGELDKKNKNPKLLTVHRLDKETTGCLLLARNEDSAQRLKSLFAQRKIVKTYWIVTIRVPDPLQGIIDIPITEGFIEERARMVLHPNLPKDIAYRNHSKRGKNAVTHYNVIAESGNAALVEVKPETGIKHQIRVHFGLGLACPILGDNKYSYPDKFVPQKLSHDMLHRLQVQQSKVRHIPMHIYARSIFIPQYTTGRNLFVMAPMPIHISKNLQRLKFKKK